MRMFFLGGVFRNGQMMFLGEASCMFEERRGWVRVPGISGARVVSAL